MFAYFLRRAHFSVPQKGLQDILVTFHSSLSSFSVCLDLFEDVIRRKLENEAQKDKIHINGVFATCMHASQRSRLNMLFVSK